MVVLREKVHGDFSGIIKFLAPLGVFGKITYLQSHPDSWKAALLSHALHHLPRERPNPKLISLGGTSLPATEQPF